MRRAIVLGLAVAIPARLPAGALAWRTGGDASAITLPNAPDVALEAVAVTLPGAIAAAAAIDGTRPGTGVGNARFSSDTGRWFAGPGAGLSRVKARGPVRGPLPPPVAAPLAAALPTVCRSVLGAPARSALS